MSDEVHIYSGAREALEAERREYKKYYGYGSDCHADSDGDCEWEGCPQLRDGEPKKSGRHCPLDVRRGED